MPKKLDVQKLCITGFLFVAFALGLLLSSTVLNAQHMTSQIDYCQATCTPPARGFAPCPDICTGVPAGQSCTCLCSADNLSGGECYSTCDYGVGGDAYCDN